jgi:PAS domain-containing protein
MSRSALSPAQLASLRFRATARLRGSTEPSGVWQAPLGAADALAVLHQLASSPDTAQDALALLHELQVHQVELEMQAEELRESRLELEAALRRQIELYDGQPVACFTLDRDSVIHELNQRGAQLLGLGRDEACGLRLDGFFVQASAHVLRLWLTTLGGEGADPSRSGLLSLSLGAVGERVVRAFMQPDPTSPFALLVLAPRLPREQDA